MNSSVEEKTNQVWNMIYGALDELHHQLADRRQPSYEDYTNIPVVEKWFQEFAEKLATRLPDVQMALTRDVRQALQDAHDSYQASNGRASEYDIYSVLREIIEVKVQPA